MLQCSQAAPMPPACPRWISAATRLIGRSRKIVRFFDTAHPTGSATVVAAGASSPTMKIEKLAIDFSDEQKRYLEGFTSGLQISRLGRGLGAAPANVSTEPAGPDAAHIK